MSPQQIAELEFWRGEFAKYPTPEAYIQAREVRDFDHYAEVLPEIRQETGCGLDLGCGLVSILGRLSCEKIYAVDTLALDYDKIFAVPRRGSVIYEMGDGETLAPFGSDWADFVWCTNAIDHTPHPERMLRAAYRVLKPGGRFYFFVNFDPALYAPHHTLWNMQEVEEKLSAFKLLRGTRVWSYTWDKYIYAGLYRKD